MSSGVSRYLGWVGWRGDGSAIWGLWISIEEDGLVGRLKTRGGRARGMTRGMSLGERGGSEWRKGWRADEGSGEMEEEGQGHSA